MKADIQEAHSLKYHHCAQIFLLSSGQFALFGYFTNGEGIPLLAIGSWSELESHVREYRVRADAPAGQRLKATPAAINYDNLFGDE